jgi:cellobiose phosphorylase
MESVLGIYREGNLLRIDPCLPKALGEYQVKYKYGSSLYEIQIKNTFVSLGEKPVISIDGQTIVKPNIPLTDDGRIHQVNIEFFTQKNST